MSIILTSDMEFIRHPNTENPSSDSTIWRYLDFSQLVQIMVDGQLFFPRADTFDDPYEGGLPTPTRERRDRILEGVDDHITQEFLPDLMEGFKQFTYICSWHCKPTESATMWESYSSGDITVCIESTIDRLRDALERSDEEQGPVFINSVEYKDFDVFDIPDWNPLDIQDYIPPYLYKREEYREENELRAIIQNQPSAAIHQTEHGPKIYVGDDQEELSVDADNPSGGIPVEMNLGILLKRIHVTGEVGQWKKDIVEDFVETMLENEPYSIDVVHSSFENETPQY